MYITSGWLESSVIDFGGAVEYLNLSWQPVGQLPQTGTTSVQFQLASSPTQSTSTWNYLGPDGTASTFYTGTTPDISSIHDGDQYLRYRMYLSTASSTYTPTVSDVIITYTNSCTPPGQAFFDVLASGDYSMRVTATGYNPFETAITMSGDQMYSVDLVPLP